MYALSYDDMPRLHKAVSEVGKDDTINEGEILVNLGCHYGKGLCGQSRYRGVYKLYGLRL